jgi:hypothetical protein
MATLNDLKKSLQPFGSVEICDINFHDEVEIKIGKDFDNNFKNTNTCLGKIINHFKEPEKIKIKSYNVDKNNFHLILKL